LIDVINDLDFEGSEKMLPYALEAADRIAELKARAKQIDIPVIYVNDNFGHWRSDFKEVADYCSREGKPGRKLVERLRPEDDDYFVLKPRHSGFYDTTLGTLLRHLGAHRLILTGFSGHMCVLLTAADAYMREFELYVPEDCTASPETEHNDIALAYMRMALKIDSTPSTTIDLDKLARSDVQTQPAPSNLVSVSAESQ
jgi:nicotinamidase-related amidase